MKIIDEKGRLFSRINIIDFLVALFFISLLPIFYYTYKVIGHKPSEPKPQQVQIQEKPKKEFIQVNLEGRFIRLNDKTAREISVGDKEIDNNGEKIGEVVSLGNISPYVHTLMLGKEHNLYVESPGLKEVQAKIKIKAEMRDEQLYYRNKQIVNNEPLKFRAGKYELEFIPSFKVQDNYSKAELETVQHRLSSIEEKVSILESKVDNLENPRSRRKRR